MGAEAIEDYLPPQQLSEMDGVEEDITHLHEKDIMKLNHGWGLEERIKCDSHVKNDKVKPEGDPTMDANIFPTDTLDGLPTPKTTHSFYFVRFPSIEDLKLKNEINQLDKDMKDLIRDKVSITETIRLIKMNRAQVNSSLKGLNFYYNRCRKNFEKWSCSERNEVEPLYQALRKLHSARNKIQARGNDLCSSEEELNYLISSLRYRMQHRSNRLVTEKQLLGEIKQLEGTREKVIADAAMKEKICYPWGQGKQPKITHTVVWLDEMRTERQYNGRIKALEKHVKAMDTEVSTLEKKLRTNQKRIAEYKSLNELKKQQDKWKAYYSENCLLLNNARDLAAKKDVAALEELSRTEVENYMSLWSSNKAFRDDYVKRNLASPYNRKLRSDRRMMNPDDKPLVSVVEENRNNQKEQPSEHKILPNDISLKEENYECTNSEFTVKDKTSVLVKPSKQLSSNYTINVPKVKEIEREEEIVKAHFASASKKKLAEKVTVRATLQTPNVAEMKAKEKGGALVAPTNLEEQVESDRLVLDGEDIGAPVPSKNRDQTEKTIRYSKLSKRQDSLRKLISKQNSLRSHWLWDVPAALLVILFVVLGYHYLLGSL